MSNEALTWAKWVSHQLSKRAAHMEAQAAEAGRKKPNNPYSGTPLHLLMVLADYANEDWQCWPKQSTLVDDLGGITERTIRRGLRLLEELGVVTTERIADHAGARWGTTYQLHVEALQELVDQNKAMGIATHQPRLGRSRKPTKPIPTMSMNSSPDILSGRTQSPMIASPDILSGRDPTGQKRPVLPDKNDISDLEYLKDHARINPHHQSSSARASEAQLPTATNDEDEDDQGRSYREVNIDQLFQDVPDFAGYADDIALIETVVDVVLGRARGRVAQPTAYVRAALVSDLYAVVGNAMEARSNHVVRPAVSAPAATAPTSLGPGASVAVMPGPDAVPVVSDLPEDAIPCTNMDHLLCYDMSFRMLAHCNHCRLEQRGSGSNQPPQYPHVADATEEQIAALPSRLQGWVLQWHTTDAATTSGCVGVTP